MTSDLSLGTISIPSCKFGVYGIESEADVMNDGWVKLTINDLNNEDIKSQLITEYNANHGSFNFIQQFSLGDSSCCWRVYDSTSASTHTFSLSVTTSTYLFPAIESSAMECVTTPTSNKYGFYDPTINDHLTSLSPTVTFTTTNSSCNLGNNPSIYAKCCEFAIYDYEDADSTAATNNWLAMNYADFQDASPYKEFFINAYSLNENLMKPIGSWDPRKAALTYGEGTNRIEINDGAGYIFFLVIGTNTDYGPDFKTFGTAYGVWSSHSPRIRITNLSISDQFTIHTCCTNDNNPGFYRKCTATSLSTTTSPAPTNNPTSAPTSAPSTNPSSAPTVSPTRTTVSPTHMNIDNPTTNDPTTNEPTFQPTYAKKDDDVESIFNLKEASWIQIMIGVCIIITCCCCPLLIGIGICLIYSHLVKPKQSSVVNIRVSNSNNVKNKVLKQHQSSNKDSQIELSEIKNLPSQHTLNIEGLVKNRNQLTALDSMDRRILNHALDEVLDDEKKDMNGLNLNSIDSGMSDGMYQQVPQTNIDKIENDEKMSIKPMDSGCSDGMYEQIQTKKHDVNDATTNDIGQV